MVEEIARVLWREVKREQEEADLDILADGKLVAVLHPVATPTTPPLVVARGWGAARPPGR